MYHETTSALNHCSIQFNCSSNSQSGGEIGKEHDIGIYDNFSECGSEVSINPWCVLRITWHKTDPVLIRELITAPDEKGRVNSSTSEHHLLPRTGSHPPLVLNTGGQDHSCGQSGILTNMQQDITQPMVGLPHLVKLVNVVTITRRLYAKSVMALIVRTTFSLRQ